MAHASTPATSSSGSEKRLLARILRTHWKALLFACVAVIGETAADVLEPWPITIIVDNILQGKKLSGPIGAAVVSLFGTNQSAMLEFALAAVLLMAATVLVNLTPPNPYLANTLKLWQQGHFLNFNGLTRLLSVLWAYVALGYLMYLAARRREFEK